MALKSQRNSAGISLRLRAAFAAGAAVCARADNVIAASSAAAGQARRMIMRRIVSAPDDHDRATATRPSVAAPDALGHEGLAPHGGAYRRAPRGAAYRRALHGAAH